MDLECNNFFNSLTFGQFMAVYICDYWKYHWNIYLETIMYFMETIVYFMNIL